MDKYIYSFNRYLKGEFGQRVHRISLNAGFSCPNLDGVLSTAGCIFCNNKAFSRFVRLPAFSLEEQINQGRNYAYKRFRAKKYIAYFQSFSNTYGDINFLKKQYSVIKKFDDIVGIAISTRPDCIDREKLDLIESFAKDYRVYIEYGLQTVHDRTLKLLNRRHSFADFQRAAQMTQARRGIKMAVHVILGLPGETRADMFTTAKAIAGLPLWGVKFHVLHVVKGTLLEDIHARGKVSLLSAEQYADILVGFLELLPKSMVVLRLVSDADKNLLAAPSWINDKVGALKLIEEEFRKRNTCQGALNGGINASDTI